MDGQGLQTLKPPPSVIHCHPAIISGSLIHFPVSETLLKASLFHLPFGFVMVEKTCREMRTSEQVNVPLQSSRLFPAATVSAVSYSGNENAHQIGVA